MKNITSKYRNKEFKKGILYIIIILVLIFCNFCYAYKYRLLAEFNNYHLLLSAMILFYGYMQIEDPKESLIKGSSLFFILLTFAGNIIIANTTELTLIIGIIIEFSLIYLSIRRYKNRAKQESEVRTLNNSMKIEMIISRNKQKYVYKITKHLKLINKKIKNYSTERKQIKAFCLMLVGTYCAFGEIYTINRCIVLLLAVCIPWLHDAHDLYVIKCYEKLTDEVVEGRYQKYNLNINVEIMQSIRFIFDISVIGYYGLILAILIWRSIKIS